MIAAAIVSALAQGGLSPWVAADAPDDVFTPYLWAAGIDGEAHINGNDFDTSVDFADIADHLDAGGGALLELASGSWVTYLQVDYLAVDSGDVSLRNSGLDVKLEMDSTLATVGTGYRFRTGERSSVDLLFGLRYGNFEANFNVKTVGEVDADQSQYDGVVILRPRLSLGRNWSFSPTMSVGAGDSELTWELSPQFNYDWCGTEIRIGYRNLNYDFEKGDDSLDISMRGPLIGVGFAF